MFRQWAQMEQNLLSASSIALHHKHRQEFTGKSSRAVLRAEDDGRLRSSDRNAPLPCPSALTTTDLLTAVLFGKSLFGDGPRTPVLADWTRLADE